MAGFLSMVKTFFDSNTDDPKQARAELAANVDAYNGVISVLNSGTAGQVLTSQGAGNQPVFASSNSIKHYAQGAHPGWVNVTGNGLGHIIKYVTTIDPEVLITNGIYTAPEDGIYFITTHAGMMQDAADPLPASSVIRLKISGTVAISCSYPFLVPPSETRRYSQGSLTLTTELTANDRVYTEVCADGAGATVDAAKGYFTCFKLF